MDNPHLLAGKRVLVVEDEMLVLMAIEDMLSDLGCTSISVAGNVERALELVATKSFDLATLDVNLNGRKSYPIAIALTNHGVPFAFSTGYGEHALTEPHRHCIVLNKPYTRPQFIEVINALIDAGPSPALAA